MSAAVHGCFLCQSVLYPQCSNCTISHIHTAASYKCTVKAILLNHFYRCSSHKSVYCLIHCSPCTDCSNGRICVKDLQDIYHIAHHYHTHIWRGKKLCQFNICGRNIKENRFVILDQFKCFGCNCSLFVKVKLASVYYVSLQRIILWKDCAAVGSL